jgi:Arc/MetJ-type ribon-helix-helix transcriptional regulator
MAGDPERQGRENLTFRCPKVLRDWLDDQVGRGEFSTLSEAVVYYLTTAKARKEKCEK